MPLSSSDDPLARLRWWLADERGVSVDARHVITIDGPPRKRIEASAERGDVVLTHRLVEEQAATRRIAQVRAALAAIDPAITAEVDVDDPGTMRVTLTRRIPGDVLGKHTFLGALHGLAGVVDVAGLAGPAAPSAPDRTRVMERAWAPTHVVPKGGLPAWPTPDATGRAAHRLDARVELTIAEARGDWARVVGRNGWTGWVDRRRLVPRVAAGVSTPGQPRHRDGIRVLPLVGILGTGASIALPWFVPPGDASRNALEIPMAFLWNVVAAEPPRLAWLLAVPALIVATVAVTGWGPGLFVLCGAVVLAVPAVFVVQVYRAMELLGTTGDMLRHLGPGPAVCAVAGVLIIFSARR